MSHIDFCTCVQLYNAYILAALKCVSICAAVIRVMLAALLPVAAKGAQDAFKEVQ